MSESRTFSVSIKDCLVNLLALGDLYESIATGENDNGFRIRADEAAAVMRASAHFISDFVSSHREWVSVGERLPEDGVSVLVFDKDFREPEIGTYYAADGWATLNPTHWMPLPSPPPKKD